MRHLVFYFILLFCGATALSAGDKTPYKFLFGGNSYYGSRNVSVTWLAERYDCAIAGLADWPGMHDSIYDTAMAMGKPFLCGPYASSQEINLYERFDQSKSYNDRLANVGGHWLYVYAKHYLDSIGVSVESLVVHVADDYVNLTQQGDGSRAYTLTNLPYHKRRFSYQYWNNNASDTMFYPAGYIWLANGYNEDARQAIAYAYRRYLIEDSVAFGPGDHHWTALFMDNQYRSGFAPRLYSYYSINATSGGPTGGLDWVEQPGMEIVDNNTRYYDYSTLRIDSTINAVLDSTCAANNLDPILTFANIEKFSAVNLEAVIPYVNAVSLENPLDWLKAWPSAWEQWYAMGEIMAQHPETYINWLMSGDFLCSSDAYDWRSDSSRIYLANYSFFLQVRDTNAFFSPCRFNDSTRWREIYEVDLGQPDGPAYEVSSVGTGYDKIAVMRRDYGRGNTAVLLRTSHGNADFVRDSVAVNVHGLYYEIDARSVVSPRPDSIFYLKPYMGKILVMSTETPPSVSISASCGSVGVIGETDTITYRVSDQAGIELLDIRLERPQGDTILLYMSFPPGVTEYEGNAVYTWQPEDCGYSDISVFEQSGSGQDLYDPQVLELSAVYEKINVGFAVYLVNYIFGDGAPPEPLESGDANCDNIINVGDAVYVINIIFNHGKPICCPRSGGTGVF